jgi:hypothetical protein
MGFLGEDGKKPVPSKQSQVLISGFALFVLAVAVMLVVPGKKNKKGA